MLRTIFFVLSLLADYRGVSDVLQTGAVWGVVNTGIFLTIMVCAYFRAAILRRVERRAHH
jgi:hypothetical protein